MQQHTGALMRRLAPALAAALAAAALAACGADSGARGDGERTLRIGAIPDQDPQRLQRLYAVLADHLADELGVRVRYLPVADYTAAVTAFRVGDLDLVWFGGLTGVQARTRVEGARALAQRDADRELRTVFVASARSGIEPLEDAAGLARLAGRSFTYGSESSTSGRAVPEWHLRRAGVGPDELRGPPGFSGSHDRTIELVAAGAYDAGALSSVVWDDRVRSGAADTRRVREIWRTPPYHDYHWLIRPDVDERLGGGFARRARAALLAIDGSSAREREILALFGARRFVPVGADDHRQIEQIARRGGLLGRP